MAVSRRCRLLLAAVCMAHMVLVAQATRPGPMLRGGTVVLLSGPRSGFFMPRHFPSMLEFEGPGSFDVETLDRVLQGPSVFGPPLHMFGRPAGLLEPFGLLPRRPCPFGRGGAREPDAMVKHMAAARFGPGLLSSLLAAAEDEERRAEMDTPVYTINPVSQVAALEPRRLRAGGVDFQKAGPFHGQPHEHPFRSQAAGLPHQFPREAEEDVSTSVSSGFGVSEAGAARLTPEARAALRQKHGVDVSVDRMQLGPRSFPMVTISSSDGGAVNAALRDVHAITDDTASSTGFHLAGTRRQGSRILPAKAGCHRASNATGGAPRWSFRDFVSRIGQQGEQPAAAAGAQEAQRHAAFEGRMFGDRVAAAPLRSAYVTQPPPTMSWDLFQDDGQLNGGELVFLLLCIACVAVWSRLLVLWCTYRHGGSRGGRRCRRRGRRFGPPGVAKGRDAVEDSLEAPLLNPLHQEAPTPLPTEPFRVEVAAKHTPEAPANNYVSLVYVPLKSEL